MLKRASHIIIILILMVSTTGITISKHCAIGEILEVSFTGEADHCCTIPYDCCEGEFEYHRLDLEFIGSDKQFSFDDNLSIDLLNITVLFSLSIDLDSFSNITEYITNRQPMKSSHIPSFTQSFLL